MIIFFGTWALLGALALTFWWALTTGASLQGAASEEWEEL